MLRQALDAAEQQEQQQLLPTVDSDTTLSLVAGNEEYGSLTKTASEGDDESGVEDSTLENDSDDDDEEPLQPSETTYLYRCFSWIRSLVMLVANVDNLWDSPVLGRRSRQTWCVVLFWFTMLATGYALERTTFKLMVDRTGPFRLFSAVALTATHALLLSLGMLVSNITTKSWGGFSRALGIPIVDVGCKFVSYLRMCAQSHNSLVRFIDDSNGTAGYGALAVGSNFGESCTTHSHCHSGTTHHSPDVLLYPICSSRRLLYF